MKQLENQVTNIGWSWDGRHAMMYCYVDSELSAAIHTKLAGTCFVLPGMIFENSRKVWMPYWRKTLKI